MLGRYACFVRWDSRRRRFDYTKHPMLVFNFYLRYGQLEVELHKRSSESVNNSFERYLKSTWYGGAMFKRGETPLSFEGFLRFKAKDEEQSRTDILWDTSDLIYFLFVCH